MTNWMRFIAPSAGHAVRRTMLTSIAAFVVLAGTVALKGLPTRQHEIHQNEILRFAANFPQGVINLCSQIVLIAILAYIGRRVFQIRL